MSDAFDRAVERERTYRARKRCSGGWYSFLVHLRVYVLVNLLLAAIWVVDFVVDGPEPLWFLEVALWWGVGLVAHAFAVRGGRPRPPAGRSEAN